MKNYDKRLQPRYNGNVERQINRTLPQISEPTSFL